MKKILRHVSRKLNEFKKLREEYEEKQHERHRPLRKKFPKEAEIMEIDKPIQVEVSTTSLLKIFVVILIFWSLVEIFIQLQDILIITGISLFIAMGLTPIVSRLESRSIPRPLAILILYIGFFGVLVLLFAQVVPILGQQLFGIATDLKDFFADGSSSPWLQSLMTNLQFDPAEVQKFLTDNLTTISRNLQSVAGSTFGILSGIFQGVFNLLFSLVLIFFILMEREQIARFLLLLFPIDNRHYLQEKFLVVQTKMSEWFRGQVILMVSVGLFMYIGMKIFEYTLGMEYAATIGLLAGFMELFPYIGVMITGILAGLIAVNISWVLLVAVLIWMVLTQFLEGNLLVPVIMEKVVGLSSVAVILALAIGGVLGNAIGGVPMAILAMILAIPIAATVAIFVEEYAHRDTKGSEPTK